MKFKYVGPHDAVDLVDVGTVEHGGVVEVSGAVAQSLDSQADWQRVDRPTPRKRAAKKAAPAPKTPAAPAATNTEE